MADQFTRAQRSEIMRRVKGQNTSLELAVGTALRRAGLKGWRRHGRGVLGTPDFYRAQEKLAIFVDGCWWHGCRRCYRRPKSNTEYWDAKKARNVARRNAVTRGLRRSGWRVLRLWEHDVRSNRVERALLKFLRAVPGRI